MRSISVLLAISIKKGKNIQQVQNFNWSFYKHKFENNDGFREHFAT